MIDKLTLILIVRFYYMLMIRLFLFHIQIQKCLRKLSSILKSCKDWLVDNKLSLFLGKTKNILLGPKKKLQNVNEYDFSIECDNIEIESKSNVQYLGIIFDKFLSGEKMLIIL